MTLDEVIRKGIESSEGVWFSNFRYDPTDRDIRHQHVIQYLGFVRPDGGFRLFDIENTMNCYVYFTDRTFDELRFSNRLLDSSDPQSFFIVTRPESQKIKFRDISTCSISSKFLGQILKYVFHMREHVDDMTNRS